MKSYRRIVPMSLCVASASLLLWGCDQTDTTVASIQAASNQTQSEAAMPDEKPAPPPATPAPAAPANAKPAAPVKNQTPAVNNGAAETLAPPSARPATPPVPQSTVQIVKAEPTEVDLGDIPTNDVGKAVVHLINTGDKDMNIVSARPSCGCTALKFLPNTIIKAGEKLDVDVQMNGGVRPGPIHGKTVTFVVENQPEVIVQLKANAVSFVTSTPETLDPNAMPEGKFTLKSIDNQPFKIMSVQPPVVEDIDKESKPEHQLAVSWAKFRELGISRQLIVYLDHPKCQQVFMTVNFDPKELAEQAQKMQQKMQQNQQAIKQKGAETATIPTAAPDPDAELAAMIRDGRNSEVLQKLQTGLDVNYRDNTGASLLSLAAKAGNADLVKALLATKKVDINGTDNAGRTALMHAATAKTPDALMVLLDAGANPSTRDALGGTALWWAAMQGQPANVEALLDKGADVDVVGSVTGWTPLMVAAGFGEAGSIEPLLKAHANIEAVDQLEGATPLIHAARTGTVEKIKILVKHHANLESADHNGNTPLLACAKLSGGDAEKVKALIELGANIHAKDNRGYNALDLARKRTDIRAADVIKVLEPLLGNETPAAASGEPKPAAGS